MDQATLEFLTERFDKLDNKIDTYAKESQAVANRVSVIETKLTPIVENASFKEKVRYAASVGAGAIGTGIVMGFSALIGKKH